MRLPPLTLVAIDGALDRWCGAPLWRNPYNPELQRESWAAWNAGWRQADHALEVRIRREVRRWLDEAAA